MVNLHLVVKIPTGHNSRTFMRYQKNSFFFGHHFQKAIKYMKTRKFWDIGLHLPFNLIWNDPQTNQGRSLFQKCKLTQLYFAVCHDIQTYTAFVLSRSMTRSHENYILKQGSVKLITYILQEFHEPMILKRIIENTQATSGTTRNNQSGLARNYEKLTLNE